MVQWQRTPLFNSQCSKKKKNSNKKRLICSLDFLNEETRGKIRKPQSLGNFLHSQCFVLVNGQKSPPLSHTDEHLPNKNVKQRQTGLQSTRELAARREVGSLLGVQTVWRLRPPLSWLNVSPLFLRLRGEDPTGKNMPSLLPCTRLVTPRLAELWKRGDRQALTVSSQWQGRPGTVTLLRGL